jgi:SEC-C motif-containing protein
LSLLFRKTYEECCKPYHTGEKHAPTAEALMRSRFSAFAIPNGEYLMETTFPEKENIITKDLQEWGDQPMDKTGNHSDSRFESCRI